MSAINDYVAAQNAFNKQMEMSFSVLRDDSKYLTDTIHKFQNSPGVITPADQASLDGLQLRAKSIADKLNELHGMTPPVVPVF